MPWIMPAAVSTDRLAGGERHGSCQQSMNGGAVCGPLYHRRASRETAHAELSAAISCTVQ
jgi:hypothetical protein